MDYHPKAEDEHGIEHPSFGRSETYHREVCRNNKGRSCIPRSEQLQLQQDIESNRQTVRSKSAIDLSRCTAYERYDRAFIAWRTYRNREPPVGAYEYKDHADIRPNHQPEDKSGHGDPVA